jgi:chemotaxis protein MotB
MKRLVLALVVIGCGSKPAPQQPTGPDPQVAELQKQLADKQAELDKEKAAADELRKSDAEKAAAEKELQDKLAEAVGKNGEVTTADGAVRLELVDQILFPLGEADLSDSGKEILAKVGATLAKVDDKQIWVQGHTDDTPIYVKKKETKDTKAVKADPKKKGKKDEKKDDKKDAKKPPEGNDAVLAYVTNWELSAARALTVVHYLQDDAKLDPSRLAAVAFGQYRPVSKTKSKNRRIEIVLYPRSAIAPK